MIEETTIKTTVAMLSALAQETRLSLFRLLVKQGPDGMKAGDIARSLHIPNSTLSYHLTELERAGLITSQKQQRHIIYAPDLKRLDGFLSFLIEDCCQGSSQGSPQGSGGLCFSFQNNNVQNNKGCKE